MSAWDSISGLQGDQGPEGVQGPQGIQGIQGANGIVLLKKGITEQIYTNDATEKEIGRLNYADYPSLKNGDRLRISYFATLLNNSGAALSYTFRFKDVGGPFTPLVCTLSLANSANRYAVTVQYELVYITIGSMVYAKGTVAQAGNSATQGTNNASLISVTAGTNLLGVGNFAGNWIAGSSIFWSVQMITQSASADIRIGGYTAELLAA